MELKDGKIVVTDEEKGLLQSDEGKNWLKSNGLFEKEVVKEQVNLTDNDVMDYINKHKSISDKLYNEHNIKFLKSKLGDNVDIQTLGKEIVLKDDLNKFKQEAIKVAVANGLKPLMKHSDLVLNSIDYTKLDLVDGKLIGFDEMFTGIKEKYSDLLTTQPVTPITPPAFNNDNKSKGAIVNTYEDFLKLSKEERAKVPNEVLDKILKS